jgi:hypothetical protein
LSSIKDTIEQLLQDASRFNSNDVLVDIGNGCEFAIGSGENLPLEGTVKAIIETARKTEKELGINPLCSAQGTIIWEYKQSSVRSPLFLTPCTVAINKVHKTVRIVEDSERSFINPFVINRLQRDFDLQLPADIETPEQLAHYLGATGFQDVDPVTGYIGNFHHHRFEIIKELEELRSSPLTETIQQLLGDATENNSVELKLGSALIFPTDVDQLNVFKAVEIGHTVVQGPPGTGKSQVLSNLLGKLLLSGRSAIVVSEKRVALEVLKKKLNQYGLGHLCFIASSETITRDALSELKESWNFIENYTADHPVNLQLSEQYMDQLQLHLDLLHRDSLIGGISYSEFIRTCGSHHLESSEYNSDLPEMKEWLVSRAAVKQLFDLDLHYYVSGIAPGLLKQDSFKQLDRSIRLWLNELARLKKIFVLNTYAELRAAMKRAALCQHYRSETFLKYEKILTTASREQERFLKLRKKYLQLQILHGSLQNEKSNWKIQPSLTETEGLIEQQKNNSFLGKLTFKKQWSRVSALPVSSAFDALNRWKHYMVNSQTISQLEIDFCEIGVDDVKNELEYIHQQIHHFNPENKKLWTEIPNSDRQLYADENQALHQLYSQFNTHFRWEDHVQPELFLSKLLSEFATLIRLHDSVRDLSDPLVRNLRHYSTFAAMEAAVCKSNYTRFTAQFPQFSRFTVSQLLEKCHTILSEQNVESTLLANEIIEKQKSRFRYYHKILQTPAAKLSPSEKELKGTLKKGKAILVKEFAKSRNFPALRELYASEARIWIQLLKPVWLSNPAQVAKCFPMEQGLFDLAIFDEASQIPLQHALGTIQRSKRILVAGDQQQMGPGNYFKAQAEEVTDLLHQASFYWRNVSLKHHYRSEHPELIRFSNKHFYNNELIAFPTSEQNENPIRFHFVDNGIFDERINQEEAEQAATFIKAHIDSAEHLGIVAFSETQLKAILSKLPAACLEKLENRIEEDSAFCKALENVQGEECDHLIISLGYGKDPEGTFHMRFGPLNKQNGAKRLNVLFTRAKKRIDLFASVKGNDFKISSNEAVDLLRLYLLHIENAPEHSNELAFPLGLQPFVNDKSLVFSEIYSTIRSAQELVTLVSVLEGRGWKLEFK